MGEYSPVMFLRAVKFGTFKVSTHLHQMNEKLLNCHFFELCCFFKFKLLGRRKLNT